LCFTWGASYRECWPYAPHDHLRPRQCGARDPPLIRRLTVRPRMGGGAAADVLTLPLQQGTDHFPSREGSACGDRALAEGPQSGRIPFRYVKNP
jgi:hypothetical protein